MIRWITEIFLKYSHHLSPEDSWHVIRWWRLTVDHVEPRPATPAPLQVVLRSRPQQRARLVFSLMLLLLLWKVGEVLR